MYWIIKDVKDGVSCILLTWHAGWGIVQCCNIAPSLQCIGFLYWKHLRICPLFGPATSLRFWSLLQGGASIPTVGPTKVTFPLLHIFLLVKVLPPISPVTPITPVTPVTPSLITPVVPTHHLPIFWQVLSFHPHHSIWDKNSCTSVWTEIPKIKFSFTSTALNSKICRTRWQSDYSQPWYYLCFCYPLLRTKMCCTLWQSGEINLVISIQG